MTRIRMTTIELMHETFFYSAHRWNELKQPTFLTYCFAHAVHHGLCIHKAEDCVQLLSHFEYYNKRLHILGRNFVDALRQDIDALALQNTEQSMAFDSEFFQTAGHKLTREIPLDVSSVFTQIAAETGIFNHLGNSAWEQITADEHATYLLSLHREQEGQNACTNVLEHASELQGAKLLPNGLVLSWLSDGLMFLWDRRGREVASIQVPSSIRGLDVLGDEIYTWGDDSEVHVWSVESLSPMHVLRGHQAPITSLEIHDDIICTHSADGVVRCWKYGSDQSFVSVQAALPNPKEVFPIQDGAFVITESGHSNRICFSDDSVVDITLPNSGNRKAKVDGISAIPSGNLLFWSKKGTFFVLDHTMTEIVIEGDMKEGAGGGLFGGIPNQHMSVLNHELAASWGESSFFSSAPCEVRLWSLTTGLQVGALPTTNPPAQAIACGLDILIAEKDGLITLFKENGEEKWKTKLETSIMSSGIDGFLACDEILLCWEQSTSSSLFANGKIHRISLHDGCIQNVWAELEGGIRCIRGNGQTVAALSTKGVIYVGNINENAMPISLLGLCVDVDSDGTVYVGTKDGCVWKVDTTGHEKVAQHPAPVQGIRSTFDSVMSWCDDGHFIDIHSNHCIAIPFQAKSLSVYDTASLYLKTSIQNETLYTFHSGDALRIWDMKTSKILERHSLHLYEVQWLNERILITSKGLWNLDTQEFWLSDVSLGSGLKKAPKEHILDAKYLNPDAKQIEENHWITTGTKDVVRYRNQEPEILLDAESHGTSTLYQNQYGVAIVSEHGMIGYANSSHFWFQQLNLEDITNACATRDNGVMVFSKDGRILLIQEGEEPIDFHGHAQEIYGFEREESFAISWSKDRTLRYWNMDVQQDQVQKEYHRGGVHGVLRHNGMCVSWGEDGVLRVWDESTGICVHTLREHSSPIVEATIVGDFCISWDEDGTIVLWEHEGWTCSYSIQAHSKKVCGIQIYDTTSFVSWSDDPQIHLWNLHTGEKHASFEGHEGSIQGVTVIEDELLSWSKDGTVRLWNMQGEEKSSVLIEKSSGMFGFMTNIQVKCEQDWVVVTSSKKLAFWPQKDWSAPCMLERKKGEVLGTGIVHGKYVVMIHSSMMAIMMGKSPSIDFWSLDTGDSASLESVLQTTFPKEQEITQDNLMKHFQNLMEYIMKSDPSANTSGEWTLTNKQQNLILSNHDRSLYWLGNSDLKAHYLDSSGLICATSAGGDVHLLHVYQGGERIGLSSL